MILLLLQISLYANASNIKWNPEFIDNACSAVLAPGFIAAYKNPEQYQLPIIDDITDRQIIGLFEKANDSKGEMKENFAKDFINFSTPIFKQKFPEIMQVCASLTSIKIELCKKDHESAKCDEKLIKRADSLALIKDLQKRLSDQILRPKPGAHSETNLPVLPKDQKEKANIPAYIFLLALLVLLYFAIKTLLKKLK